MASIKKSDQVHCIRLLGCAPHEIDAGEISPARRQGLLWCKFTSTMSWHYPISVWYDTVRLEPTGGPSPVLRWKAAHVTWPPSGLDRFATFLCARPNNKEPPLFLSHGRDRCNKEGHASLEQPRSERRC